MKLTIKENPDAIRRYAHIRPASPMAARVCSTQCPGTNHTCTLQRGHSGVHVAHGRFRKVVAVWDRHARIQEPKQITRAGKKAAIVRKGKKDGRAARIRGWVGRFVPSSHSIEAVFLLVLLLGMVGFAIDLAIRIFGAF